MGREPEQANDAGAYCRTAKMSAEAAFERALCRHGMKLTVAPMAATAMAVTFGYLAAAAAAVAAAVVSVAAAHTAAAHVASDAGVAVAAGASAHIAAVAAAAAAADAAIAVALTHPLPHRLRARLGHLQTTNLAVSQHACFETGFGFHIETI
jgi:hypothetical protein